MSQPFIPYTDNFDDHVVTSAESVATYCLFEITTGTTNLIQIESISGRDANTHSKIITLGFRNLQRELRALKTEAQVADVDGNVCYDGRAKVKARSIYIRVESPALNDVIGLGFAFREVTS